MNNYRSFSNINWFTFYNFGSDYVALVNNRTLKKIYFTVEEYEKLIENGKLKEILLKNNLNTEELKKNIKNRKFRPRVSYIITTGNCNINCDYCYIEPIAKQFYLNKEDADKIINNIKKVGVEKIIFYGGEPLLNKEIIYYILEKLEGMPIKKGLITNGTLVTEEFAKKAKKYGMTVSISLDGGVYENIHRHDTKKESFYKALRGIAILKEEGVQVGISATITKENVYKLPETLEFFKNLGIKGMGFNILLRTKENKELAPNPKTLAYFLYKAMKKSIELGIFEDRTTRRLRPFLEEKFKFFDCPWLSSSAIDFGKAGEIAGCQAFLAERTPGKVFKSTEEYIKSLEEIKKIGTIFNKKCEKCAALGICGGVCPYHSLINSKKLGVIDDDFCKYIQKTYGYLIDFYYKSRVQPFSIEEVQDKDFKGLVKLFKKLKNSYLTIDNEEESAISMLKINERNYGKVLILKEKNKIIGFANSVFKNKKEMEIGVGILEKYRNKGIGKILMANLLAETKLGYTNKENILIKVTINKQNTPSIKLFETFKFTKKDEKNKAVLEKELKEIKINNLSDYLKFKPLQTKNLKIF